MVIPPAVEDLDETHAPFDHPASEQAVAGKGAVLMNFRPVRIHHLFGLAGQGTGLRNQLGQVASRLKSFGDSRRAAGVQGASLIGQIGQGQVQQAGSRFTGDLVRAQQMQQLGGEAFQVGSQIAGAAVGGGGLLGGGGGSGLSAQGGPAADLSAIGSIA